MSDCEEMLMGMTGWIRVVAAKFSQRSVGIEQEDYEQEAMWAILKKGTSEEALAKTVAIRAMRKYRDRFGEERVTGRVGEEVRKPLKRVYPRLHRLPTRTQEPSMIFWDNLSGVLTDREMSDLKSWVDGGPTGGGGGVCRAMVKLRQKWEVTA